MGKFRYLSVDINAALVYGGREEVGESVRVDERFGTTLQVVGGGTQRSRKEEQTAADLLPFKMKFEINYTI